MDKEIPELNDYNANSSFILRLDAQLYGKMQLNHWMHQIGFWHLEVDHVSFTSLETNWLGKAQGLYRGMQKSSSTTKDVRGVSSRRSPIRQRNIRIRRSDALQLTGMPGVPGKDLTLFRCTMRSQQKWWFLSEADEEQLGTDRDIDYYQYKSKEDKELQPPPRVFG